MNFSTIETLVAEVLSDNAKVVWTQTQLRRWIVDAELAVINVKPDASIVTENFSCIAGSVQTLPSRAIKLIRVNRNIGAASAPGRAIRLVDKDYKDDLSPNWHAQTQSATIKEYIFDDRLPKQFMVSPPALAGTIIDISYSAEPLPYNIFLDASLTISDIYQPALVEWVLYRCFSRSDEDTPEFARAQSHFSKFFDLLGVRMKSDMNYSPNAEG
jgi:hypothetical protein